MFIQHSLCLISLYGGELIARNAKNAWWPGECMVLSNPVVLEIVSQTYTSEASTDMQLLAIVQFGSNQTSDSNYLWLF